MCKITDGPGWRCDGVLADRGMGMGDGYMGVFGVAMWGCLRYVGWVCWIGVWVPKWGMSEIGPGTCIVVQLCALSKFLLVTFGDKITLLVH